MELCKADPFARTLLYSEVCQYYRWNKDTKTWSRRKQGVAVPDPADPSKTLEGIKKGTTVGRVYTVHPKNKECYCLRFLLNHVRGPTSFEDLKRKPGTDETFKYYTEACIELGLLADDSLWDSALDEAKELDTASKIRSLFAVMLRECEVSNPSQLWHKYKKYMCDDILFQWQHQILHRDVTWETDGEKLANECLKMIKAKYLFNGGLEQHWKQLLLPEIEGDELGITEFEQCQSNVDIAEMENYIQENELKLEKDQKKAYDKIIHSVNNASGKMFFIDAPGGTGKTFVLNLLLKKVRQSGDVAIAVAASGIAATLLDQGRTAHNAFKLPVDIHSSNGCSISKGTKDAKLLKEAKLIVWDECTMTNKEYY